MRLVGRELTIADSVIETEESRPAQLGADTDHQAEFLLRAEYDLDLRHIMQIRGDIGPKLHSVSSHFCISYHSYLSSRTMASKLDEHTHSHTSV